MGIRDDWFTASKSDPGIKAILRATHPDYTGRTIKVAPTTRPIDVTSYWDGGTRSYYAAVDLRTMRTLHVPQNGTPYDGGPIRPDGVEVPVGFAIVEHAYFCGKDLGIRIHVHPDSLPKLLPQE